MEVVDVPKPTGRKRMVAKASTMETAVARAAVKPVVPDGFRIGNSPDEEH